ncbi:MAG: (2Fe-2S)-binding protein [Polyangia bacterium]
MSRSRSELPSSGSAGSVGAAPDELPAGPDTSGDLNRATGGAGGGATGDGLSRRGFLQTGTSAAGAAALLGLPTVAPAVAAAAPVAVPPPAVLGPGAVPITLLINGKETKVAVEPTETLASVLRDRMGLTGTKIGCDRGACGACTVWIDGQPTGACMTLALDVGGTGGPAGLKPRAVTTIEGLQKGAALHPVQQAFIEADALQCGFCTPGMVMSCAALLERRKQQGGGALAALTASDVCEAIAGNLCRCGSYPHVVSATLKVAQGGGAPAAGKPGAGTGPAPGQGGPR